jgi:1-acyl-sn-glycerol-3-phosphate acyltransferase
MINSLLVLATLIVLGFPSALVFIPWALISGNVNPLYNAACWTARMALRVGGVRIETQGLSRVPAGTACIFMSNHISNLDPPALYPLIPGRASAFIKHSLMRIPILGYAFKLGELIPVSRDGSVQGAQESVAVAKRVLAKGLHIITFVEGTRSPDGRLLPFKKGPFYLAMEAGAPCIPVSISGTENLMGKGSLRIRRGTAHLIFHSPIHPRDHATREDLLAAVRDAIASGLPEQMRG